MFWRIIDNIDALYIKLNCILLFLILVDFWLGFVLERLNLTEWIIWLNQRSVIIIFDISIMIVI